jgi:hypothetical protein
LRGLSDHQKRPEGFGDDAAGVKAQTIVVPAKRSSRAEPGPIRRVLSS